MKKEIKRRISLLREEMRRHKISAAIIPSADPHLSEYVPEHWSARAWLSGFTGSAGTLAVTKDKAALWTDSRYWIQSEMQLKDTEIIPMRLTSAPMPYLDWLQKELKKNATISLDGNVFSLNDMRKIKETAKDKKLNLRTDLDLLRQIWKDRPPLPDAKIYEHPIKFACVSRSEKLKKIREEMQNKKTDFYLISALDDIAWLFNLRGADIRFNPFFISYALIGKDHAKLFTDKNKVSDKLRKTLAKDNVKITDYKKIKKTLAKLSAKTSLLIDANRTNYAIASLPKKTKIIEADNPTVKFKTTKTAKQIANIRATMEEDGAALCNFFAWLEDAQKKQTITELDIDAKLLSARKERKNFLYPSFATIAGFNENGALPHYQATKESYATIKGKGLLLIDSGGQYPGGTTDITRTVAIGKPTDEQKRDFTLVLKSAIALTTAKFPKGTRAPMLDAITRAPLWAHGLDYGHGTGHGVGYFLGVHEPPSISINAAPTAPTTLNCGIITSIEPALYRGGKWGIRTENLVAVKKSEYENFMEFEVLTLCPIDKKCINVDMLTKEELNWLNDYHAEVRKRLLQKVNKNTRNWLIEQTKTLIN